MMGYYDSTNAGSYTPGYFSGTQAFELNFQSRGGVTYIYVCAADFDYSVKIDAPKSWRWFDIFRTYEKPKSLQIRKVIRHAMFRVQERLPARQRSLQKRKAYLHKLYAR
jgi:hypothetical protein